MKSMCSVGFEDDAAPDEETEGLSASTLGSTMDGVEGVPSNGELKILAETEFIEGPAPVADEEADDDDASVLATVEASEVCTSGAATGLGLRRRLARGAATIPPTPRAPGFVASISLCVRFLLDKMDAVGGAKGTVTVVAKGAMVSAGETPRPTLTPR